MIHSEDNSAQQLKFSSNQSSVKDSIRHSLGATTNSKNLSYFQPPAKPFDDLSPSSGADKRKFLNNSTTIIKGRKIAQPVLRVMTNLKLTSQNTSNLFSFSSSGAEGKYFHKQSFLIFLTSLSQVESNLTNKSTELSSFNHSTQTKQMLKKAIENQTKRPLPNASINKVQFNASGAQKNKRSGNNSLEIKKKINNSDPGYSSSGRVNSPYRKVQQAMQKKQQQILKGRISAGSGSGAGTGRPPLQKPKISKQSKSSTMKSPQTLNSEIKTVSFGATQQMHMDFDKENQNLNSNSPMPKTAGILDLSVSSVSGYSENRSALMAAASQGLGHEQKQRNEKKVPLSPSFDKNKEDGGEDMFENQRECSYGERMRVEFTPVMNDSGYQNIRAETEMDVFNMLKGIGSDSQVQREQLLIENGQTKSTKEFQETGKFINPLEYELAMNNTACKFGNEYPQTLQVDIQNETPQRGKTQKINSNKNNPNISQISASIRTQSFAHSQQLKRKFKRNSYSLYISNKTPTMMGQLIKKDQKVDRIVKDNLKKANQQKEIEEFNKILVEEDKIMKRKELQNHNNQVRIFNAQKVQQRKKGRSVSCMNKIAPATSPMNFRHSLHTPHNIKAPSTLDHSVLAPAQQSSKNHSMIEYQRKKDSQIRRKSFVLEFREIKREIEKELKKEQREKAKNDRDTIDSIRRKEMSPLRPKKLTLNKGKRTLSNQESLTLSSKKISIRKIKQAPQVIENSGTFKKPRLVSNLKKESIRKFMHDQKKKILKKKSLEKSCEIDKTKKIKGNLRKLHRFIKTQVKKGTCRRSPDRLIGFAPSRVSSRGVNRRAESAKGYTQMQKMKQTKLGRDQNISGSAFIDDPQRQAQLMREVRTGNIYQGSPDISDIETQHMNDLIQRRDLYHDTSNEDLADQPGHQQNLTEMSTEFYVEYFKILNNIQKGSMGIDELNGLLYQSQKQSQGGKKGKSKKKRQGGRKASNSEPVSTTNKQHCQQHDRTASYGGQGQLGSGKNTASDDEIDEELQHLIQFHANVILIQQRYRQHLMEKGFYDQMRVPLHQHYYNQNPIDSDEIQDVDESDLDQQDYQLQHHIQPNGQINFHPQIVKSNEKSVHISMINSDENTRVGSAGKIIISKDASKNSSYRSKDQTVRSHMHQPQPIKAEEEFEFDDDQFNQHLEQQKAKQIENAMGIIQASDRGAQRPPLYQPGTSQQVFEYNHPHSASNEERKQVSQAANPESLYVEESKEPSGRISQNSQLVPSLNLSKLKDPAIAQPQPRISTGQRSSQRDSIFDRHSFQDFKDSQKKVDFIDMLRMRESLMVQEVETKKKKLDDNVSLNLISPRTAQVKQLELEKWVSQEREEIKKIKISFQEQWDKTRAMIEQMPEKQAYIKQMLDEGPGALKSQRSMLTSRGGSQVGTARERLEKQYEHQSVIQMISGKPSLRSREEDDETVRRGEKVYIQDEERQFQEEEEGEEESEEDEVLTVDIDSRREMLEEQKDQFMVRGEINLNEEYGEEEEEEQEEDNSYEDPSQYPSQVQSQLQSPDTAQKVELIHEEEFFTQTQKDDIQFEQLTDKYGVERQDTDVIQTMAIPPHRENMSPMRLEDETMENASSTDARILKSQSEFSADMLDFRQRTYSDDGGIPKQPSHPIEYVEMIPELKELETSDQKDNMTSQQQSVQEYDVEDPVPDYYKDDDFDSEKIDSDVEQLQQNEGDQSPTALSRQVRTHKQLPPLRISGEEPVEANLQKREDKVTSERSSMEGKILESAAQDPISNALQRSGGSATLPSQSPQIPQMPLMPGLVGETSQASLQSPYHQENFFTKGFDERPMEDVIDEIKSSTQQNNIAEIIKEIQEEGFGDDQFILDEDPLLEDPDRFNEKNRTFNTTGGGSNYIKVVEEEDDGKPSEEDEEIHQKLSIDEHYDEPPVSSAKNSPTMQHPSSDNLRQTSDEEVRSSFQNSEFEWHEISVENPIQQESLESMADEDPNFESPAPVVSGIVELEKAPPTSPLARNEDTRSRMDYSQKRGGKIRFEEENGNIISLSSGENLDDFYEQEPKRQIHHEEVKTQIITGSQSLESTLSEEGKLRLQTAVKIINDPISLDPSIHQIPEIPSLNSPASDGLPREPSSNSPDIMEPLSKSDSDNDIGSSGEYKIQDQTTKDKTEDIEEQVENDKDQKVIKDKDGIVDWITDSILHSLQFELLKDLKGNKQGQSANVSLFNIPGDISLIDSSDDSAEFSALIDNSLLNDLLKNVKPAPELPPHGFMEKGQADGKSGQPEQKDNQEEEKALSPSQSQRQNSASRAPLFILFENDGIRTDLIGIAKFVEEVYSRVKESKYKEDFLDSLLTPVRKDPLDMLNQLQNSEIGSYEHFEAENLVVIQNPVIPLELYLEIEKERKAAREGQDNDPSVEKVPRKGVESEDIPDHRVGRRKYEHVKKTLHEMEHIHNKSLFDCVNETLCQFRPYSKEGEPQPWSRKQRKLKTNRIRSDELDIERIFELVKHDVSQKFQLFQLFQWAIMQTGTLPRKEFIFGGLFDDELFAEIREKKLATLLATEVLENEPQWLNYEFEEAQVKIDLGDMILEHLVTEVIHIANAITERRQEGEEHESVWRNKPANLLPPVVVYPTDRTGMFDTDESYDISSY